MEEGTMYRRWSVTAIAVSILASAPLFAASAPAPLSVEGETRVYDTTGRIAENEELHRSLVARESAKGMVKAIEVRLSAEELAAAEPREEDGRLRVGIEKALSVPVKLVNVHLGAGDDDGMVTWIARITSPGASGIRVHFAPFDLPENGQVYVYSADGQAFGPYTGRGPLDEGELWTNTIFGDEVRIQVRVTPEDARHSRLGIVGIGYLGGGLPMAGSNLCSANASCVVNAACVNVSQVTAARDAVASILFASSGGYYICTGTLIADSDASSTVPYFLTAHHCISTSGEASSLETYFDYETTCSNPNCTQPYNNTGDTVGATIMATGSSGDYSLLRLSSAPTTKDGVANYLGWSTTAVANTNGTHLYRISHPQGSPQAYSQQDVDTSKTTCRSLPRGTFIYSRDVTGATEGGSSGSSVLNSSGQIVGQLYGACGFNLNDVCDEASNATVDGAFATYYSQVAPYLAGGGSQCSAAGASCTADSQCCSGNCKGRPGGKTCK
jgi:V8-like Glu-specific endopeptidase